MIRFLGPNVRRARRRSAHRTVLSERGAATSRPIHTSVLVVHGVADQAIGETVRALSAAARTPTWSALSERIEILESADGAFRTVQIDGEVRKGESVTFHELHWADLSRPERGALGVLATLFRLVTSLPQYVLEELRVTASVSHGMAGRYLPRLLDDFLTLARLVSTHLFQPIAFVALGILAALSLPASHAAGWIVIRALPSIAWLSVLAMLVAAALPALDRSRWLAGALGAVSLFGLYHLLELTYEWPGSTVEVAFTLLWCALGYRLFVSRDATAERKAWMIFVMVAVFAGIAIRAKQDPEWTYAAVAVFEALHAVLGILLVATAAFVICALVVWCGCLHAPAPVPRLSTTALMGTAAATLWAPAVFVPGLAAMFRVARPSFPLAICGPAFFPSLATYLAEPGGFVAVRRDGVCGPCPPNPMLTEDVALMLDTMVRASGTTSLPIVLGAAVLVVFAAGLYFAVPMLVTTSSHDEATWRACARWVDRGLHRLVNLLAGYAVFAVVLTAAGVVLELLVIAKAVSADVLEVREVLAPIAGEAIGGMGLGLVAGATSLTALAGRIESVADSLWPGLDVVNDVHSYLDPMTRARIEARADAAITRALHRADRVVVVAHSQGTVIACDLLRRRLGSIEVPIELVTCGSPLGHLYERFFPSRFAWLKRATSDPARELGVGRWTNFGALADFVGMRIVATEAAPQSAFREVIVPMTQAKGHTSYFTRECRVLVSAVREAIDASPPRTQREGVMVLPRRVRRMP